jgi:hypothetical protein
MMQGTAEIVCVIVDMKYGRRSRGATPPPAPAECTPLDDEGVNGH